MLLWIALPTLAIYLLILGISGYLNYQHSLASAQHNMMELAISYAARFDAQLREAVQIAETNASFMQTAGAPADAKLYEQLEQIVEQSPMVYGGAIAFEPGTVKPAGELFAPYVCRSPDGLRRVNIDRSVYDWYSDPQYTWFNWPKTLGRGIWTNPYFDEGAGNILMATYSTPFELDGKFGGVCTVDIDLPKLHESLGRDFERNLHFVILTHDGHYVYDENPSRIMTKTIFDVAAENQQPALEALGRRMLAGASGFGSVKNWDSPERQWVFFAPIESANWVFACRFPESMVLADVRRTTAWNAAALGLTLALIALCIDLASRGLTRPIVQLTGKVRQLGRGGLDVRIEQTSRTKEINQLAASFNRMTGELQSHIEQLANETAARERMEKEIDLAREIQHSLLPKSPPAADGYDVAGWSRPASQTGGDYYGWIELPDGRVVLTIADATGHGIGPALLITVYRAYLRASAGVTSSVEHTLARVNELLLTDLPEGRFVTAAVAILDPSRHQATLYSAGHAPILFREAATKSILAWDADDLPLGLSSSMGGAQVRTVSFAQGDALVLITDGFFEAANTDGGMYGIDRVRQCLAKVDGEKAEVIIDRLHDEVAAFVGSASQRDDMTAVVIQRLKVSGVKAAGSGRSGVSSSAPVGRECLSSMESA